MKIIFALFFLIILFSPHELRAQTVEPEKNQKSNKTIVSVPVSVSDRDGRYISGLKKEDFVVYQDGVEQKITSFATYDEPLSVALLLDTSVSTKFTLAKIKDAAKDFIELLNPDDKCLIATFDSQVSVLNDLTGDQKTLKKSLEKVQTATVEGTVVYRAVEQIAQKSFDKIAGRKVMVILSDGKDLGSSVTKDKLMDLLEESDVSIYTVFYKTGAGDKKIAIDANGAIKESPTDKKEKKKKTPKKKKGYTVFIPAPLGQPSDEEIKLVERNADLEAIDSLKEMSEATAGRFYLSNTEKLNEVFKQVAGELRLQYQLGFRAREAANSGETIHDINVKVVRSDAVVRARGKFRAKRL